MAGIAIHVNIQKLPAKQFISAHGHVGNIDKCARPKCKYYKAL